MSIPPNALTAAMVGASIRLIQSHRILPPGVLHQQCPLSDGEGWVRADTGQARLKGFNDIVVVLLQFIQGCPLLAVPADILALILTYWARCGGLF